jgi:hypothetical protein
MSEVDTGIGLVGCDELQAICDTNDVLQRPAFQHINNLTIYQPLADRGLVIISNPPGDFDPKHFVGVTITDAGRVIVLRAQLAAAQAHVQTARECIEYFADGDNWLRDGRLDPNSGNFTGTTHARAALALIQPTEPRNDAAKE